MQGIPKDDNGHTPGPWVVKSPEHDSRAFDVYAAGWKVHHGAWGREADARLIAAAPDLAASLGETAATLELFASKGDVTAEEVAEVLARARAALEKAGV